MPIEIKARELFGVLFFAHKAIKRGYRVILGNKALINQIINQKKKKAGILIYKGGGHNPELLINLSKKLDSVCVIDIELGVAIREMKLHVQGRFHPKTIEVIDRFYFLGQSQLDGLLKYTNVPKDKLLVTGWPNLDVWRTIDIWQDEVENLKKCYGDFILFSSDFGTITKFDIEQRAKRSVKWTHIKDKERYLARKKMCEARYKGFLEMVEYFKEMSKMNDVPHIIVRPHPAENFSAWYEALDNYKGITVINSGPITPWLIASKGLIHSGCTTAFEALLVDKKSAYFEKTTKLVGNPYTLKISEKLRDINDFTKWLKTSKMKKKVSIDPDIALVQDKNASELILDDIDTFQIHSDDKHLKPKIPFLKKMIRLLLPSIVLKACRNIIFIISNPGLLPLASDYQQKMSGGITLDECIIFLKKIGCNTDKVNITKLEKDLISLEIVD